MASMPEYDTGLSIPNTEVPQSNTGLAKTLQQQQKAYNDYRDNLPKIQKDLYSQYETPARQNLAQGIKQTQKDFNKRGLLNSGLRLGGEAKQKAGAEADMANARYNINQNTKNNLNTLQSGVVGTAYNMANANPNLGNASLGGLASSINQNISNQQMYGQISNQAGQLAGYGLGSYLGSKPNMNMYYGQPVNGYGPTAPGSSSGLGSISG